MLFNFCAEQGKVPYCVHCLDYVLISQVNRSKLMTPVAPCLLGFGFAGLRLLLLLLIPGGLHLFIERDLRHGKLHFPAEQGFKEMIDLERRKSPATE